MTRVATNSNNARRRAFRSPPCIIYPYRLPYNTGHDFVYRDNFTQSQVESDEAEGETLNGERMVTNQKTSNRYHANWLNLIYPRLRIAKDLLHADGVIFISIDDNEEL